MNNPAKPIEPIILRNVFGDAFLTITTLPEHGIIIGDWLTLISVRNVKDGANAALKVMEQTGYTQLLNDNTHLIGTWDEANEWLAAEWMPKAIGLGLARFAQVIAPNIFGQMAAEHMRQNVGDFFEMRMFKNRAEALAWLAS